MEVVRRNSEEVQGDENSLLVNRSFEQALLWNVTFRHEFDTTVRGDNHGR
jgi:hypothetical protein